MRGTHVRWGGSLALALALVLALATSPVSAADPLTDGEIEKSLSTMRALQPLHQKYGEQIAEYAKTVKRPEAGADHCAMTNEVRNAPGFKEMEQVVRKNGFKNGEAYCRVTERMVRAYMALRVEEQKPQLQQKLAEARQQIEADPNMPAEKKQQLLTRLTEHPAINAARNVPQDDKQVVARHRAEIEQLFMEQAPPPGAGAPPAGAAPPPAEGASQ